MNSTGRSTRSLRALGRDEDGTAILLVLLAIMVVGALSVLSLGTIIAQVQPTSFQKKDLLTVNGAEAGLDAGLAAIRNATATDSSGTTLGDRSLLPCWTNYVGQVTGTGAKDVSFTATISYFSSDPSNQTTTWRNANDLSCGAFGPPITPSYALVQSSGQAAGLRGQAANVGNRTMETVYLFKLTDTNVSGGLIKSSAGLCYAATSDTPAIGSSVKVQTCAPGTGAQLWAFRPDFTIQLTASQTTVSAAGLCISGAPASAGATTGPVSLQTCNGNDYKQKWGISDARAFFGHLLGNFANKWYLTPISDTVGGVLEADGNSQSVLPDAQVGSGAAGTTSDIVDGVALQWVNYKEFGRCLDITDWVLNSSPYSAGRPSEISYPCKQDPMLLSGNAGALPGWNEVFTWASSSKQFFLLMPSTGTGPYTGLGTKYCMKTSTVSGGYVTFDTSCNTSADYQWTVNRDTGASNTRYTIVDGYGKCLSVGPQNLTYPTSYTYSSIIVSTCSGATAQKWNAPPSLQDSPTKNTQEIKDH
jgi:Ricin-type beta-trefoil lectin domain